MKADPIILGRRSGNLPPPPRVVWESLIEPRRQRSRDWLKLLEDEIEPTIVESLEPKLVVWSSIWPHTPDQLIRFDLQPEGTGTSLTWTLTSPIEMDSSAVGHRRYRLNQLIWAELRYSYGS